MVCRLEIPWEMWPSGRNRDDVIERHNLDRDWLLTDSADAIVGRVDRSEIDYVPLNASPSRSDFMRDLHAL